MGCPSQVEIGNNLTFSIVTHDADTGRQTDASAVPTYRVYEEANESVMLSGDVDDGTGAGSQEFDDGNTTGLYVKTIACTTGAGFENGKSYTIYITATVDTDPGGITYGFTAYTNIGGSALDAAVPASPTADSINEWMQVVKRNTSNQLEITEANGNTTVREDDNTTAAWTVAAAFTSDATTTTRKQLN